MPKMTAVRKPVQKASVVPARMLQRRGKPAVPLHPVLRLQQTAGNQAVGQLIQAKLKVGQPGNQYEREADRVADQVMRMPEPDLRRQVEPQEEEEEILQTQPLAGQITPLLQRQVEDEEEEEATLQPKLLSGQVTGLIQRQMEDEDEEEPLQMKSLSEHTPAHQVQRKCAACASGQGLCPSCAEEQNEIRRKPLASTITPLIQRQDTASGQTPTVTADVQARIQSLRGGGQPLPETTRTFFESRFDYDFGQVSIHNDMQAAEAARSVNARAFTTGQDVVFGAGQYAPETQEGRRLLAHELTHVVQQGTTRNRSAGIQRQSLLGADEEIPDTELENSSVTTMDEDEARDGDSPPGPTEEVGQLSVAEETSFAPSEEVENALLLRRSATAGLSTARVSAELVLQRQSGQRQQARPSRRRHITNIDVNLTTQTMVYTWSDGTRTRAQIASGRGLPNTTQDPCRNPNEPGSNCTPVGRFTTGRRAGRNHTNRSGAAMPYAVFLRGRGADGRGIAIHMGRGLGQPASHGCIRTTMQHARTINRNVRRSTRVRIHGRAPTRPWRPRQRRRRRRPRRRTR